MPQATFTANDPRQVALNMTTGDLLLINGRFSFTNGLPGIEQDLVIRLRLFLNEWFLNLDAGVDWWGYLGEKFTADKEAALHGEIRRVVLETPGVYSITQLSFSLDSTTRSMSIAVTAATAFGDVDITTGVTNE